MHPFTAGIVQRDNGILIFCPAIHLHTTIISGMRYDIL
jgi:hypothetical protein